MTEELKQKIFKIIQSVSEGNYRYTIHGAQQVVARNLKRNEIEEAISSGEIIEDYPEHHYGPACLILGKTDQGKAIHMVCSQKEPVDIITVYEPDLIDWEPDLKTRRKKV